VFKLVRNWLRNEKNGPWLLVLDNADDADVLSPRPSNSRRSQPNDHDNSSSSALQQRLSSYLPPCGHGSVLVTSRTKHAAMQIVDYSNIVPIDAMHSEAAYALIRKKIGVELRNDHRIPELASALDYIPLALVQAAAYIRRRAPRCSVSQYLDAYHQSDGSKTTLLNHDANALRHDESASNSVLLTWQISFDHIRSQRRSATDLLSLMSFFDRQGIQDCLLRTHDTSSEETRLLLRATNSLKRTFIHFETTRSSQSPKIHTHLRCIA
jgi:hypothetical protein